MPLSNSSSHSLLYAYARAVLLGALVLCIAPFISTSNAADFSQRTRLSLGGGYSFAKHSNGFYNPYYRTSDTSKLFYKSHRGLGQLQLSWDGFWKLRASHGLYIRTAPTLTGGGGSGNLIDQDFCAQGAEIDIPDEDNFICPQETSLWSETDSPTKNWFLNVELTNAIGIFLSRPDSRGRDFGFGITFGYAYHNENDLAQGIRYRVYLTDDYRNSDPPLQQPGVNVIGNKVSWHYPLVGIEVWTEQVPKNWQRPIIVKLAANYIPVATFREEDSHFLRVTEDDFADTPNIISNGEGEGFQLRGSLLFPVGRIKPPYPSIILTTEWQRLSLLQGNTVFHLADGSTPSYPLTRFTTEYVAVALGFSLEW